MNEKDPVPTPLDIVLQAAYEAELHRLNADQAEPEKPKKDPLKGKKLNHLRVVK
ncbi:hypothetical protein D3C83_149180 [compost metagenome]